MAKIKERYAEFLRYPNAEARRIAGLPPTKGEFCRKWHIDRATPWHWEQDAEFMRKVYDTNLDAVSVQDVAEIIQALKNKAKSGNTQAAKMILDWVGITGKNPYVDLEPHADIVASVANMTDKELEAMLAKEDAEEEAECQSTPQTE